jgi:hypothetical protein
MNALLGHHQFSQALHQAQEHGRRATEKKGAGNYTVSQTSRASFSRSKCPVSPCQSSPGLLKICALRRGGFSGSYLPTRFCSFAPLGSRDFETSFHLKRGLVPGKTPRFHSNPEHNQPDGSGWSRVTTPPLYPWLFPPLVCNHAIPRSRGDFLLNICFVLANSRGRKKCEDMARAPRI